MASNLRTGGFINAPRNRASGGDNGGLLEYPIANALATNIHPGDPVALNATGTIVVASVSTQLVVGVFQGLKPEGQPGFVPTQHFPSGTSARPSFLGAGRPIALVIPAYDRVFEIQADASLSAGDLGYNFDVTVGTGTALGTKRLSTARLQATTRATSVGVCKLVGFVDRTGEAVTDAFPYALVQFNNTIDSRVSLA
jgi:hypothetical protein